MTNITSLPDACNTANNIYPSDVSAYFDKLQVWLPQPLSRAQQQELTGYCESIYVKTKRPKWDFHGHYRQFVQLRQPSAKARLFLSNRIHGVYLNGVEITLDWTFDDWLALHDASEFVRWLWRKRWHGNQQVKDDHAVRYMAQEGASNVPLSYGDEPSRVTGEMFCLHLDWRVNGTEALRRIGIHSIDDLNHFDFRKFWEPRLLFQWVDLERLGRMAHNHQTGATRRTPWLSMHRGRVLYDKDRLTGGVMVDALGSTQRVIDTYRKQFNVSSCLHRIDIPARLLPTANVSNRRLSAAEEVVPLYIL